MTQYKKKTDFTRGQPVHPPKVPENPTFIVILNAWSWNANSSLWFRNAGLCAILYNYTTSQMWKNLSNAKWCAWLIDEIVAYSRQIWWLTGTSELNDIHSFCFAWARELQRSFNCFLHLCIWVLM